MLSRTLAALRQGAAERMEMRAMFAIDLAEGELRTAYARVYRRVIEDFAPWSYGNVRSLAGKRHGGVPEWIERLIGVMRQVAGRRISLVVGTLKEQVRGVLGGEAVEQMLRDGFGIDKIVRELREPLAEAYAADWQIERLARTEVIGSSNFASQAGAEQAAADFDLDLVKVWLATNDDRTRDTHRAMNEQRQPMGEPFRLPSGALLQFPGDPQADAPGEVINCRCAIAHEPRET